MPTVESELANAVQGTCTVLAVLGGIVVLGILIQRLRGKEP